jgi:cytochrome c-type biogenesis protein CcmH/NrfG
VAVSPEGQTFHLISVSKTLFVAEDIQAYILIETDKKGTPLGLAVLPSQETAALYSEIKKPGAPAAIHAYKEKRKSQPDTYTFAPVELDLLGHQLLQMKEIAAAIQVLRLNMEMHPNAFEVYDSLGEAYMANGDIQLAVYNYKKSLELNPQNKNAQEQLKKLSD